MLGLETLVGVGTAPALGEINSFKCIIVVCGADGARQRGTVCEEPSEDQERAVSCECGAAERRRTQVNRGSCPTLMACQEKKQCFFDAE